MRRRTKTVSLLLAALLAAMQCACAAQPGVSASASAREQLVAHAGGAVWGYRYTNSLEAFDCAYDNGFKYIETDLSLSSDGEVVLIHDWDSMARRMLFSPGIRSRGEFISEESFAGLTLMDAGMLADWLRRHGDCRVITDCKDDNAEVIGRLFEAYPELRGRFIIQIYSFDEYDAVKALGAEDIILTLYRMPEADADALISFGAEHPLWALTINVSRLSEELLASLTGAGIRVYAHTVNDLGEFEKWRELGLSGIYTDYFCPARWPY
ncbi:MAG: hypothetical protein K5855_00925 [Oscillospiraceae bacterium]|nr:hypothetical protein [Oscillospiraceae bacterium]